MISKRPEQLAAEDKSCRSLNMHVLRQGLHNLCGHFDVCSLRVGPQLAAFNHLGF